MSIFVNFFVNLKQRPSCLKLVHAKGNTRLLPTFFPTWKSMGLNLYDTIINMMFLAKGAQPNRE